MLTNYSWILIFYLIWFFLLKNLIWEIYAEQNFWTLTYRMCVY